ncbi:dienelactone hydrolase and related enzymes-like protein, partial [Burkholderia sp. TJI49]
MAFSKVLVGWMAACALSAAQADTLPGANAGVSPANGSLARAERFDYGDSGLPQVAANLNEQIIRIPAD